MSRKDFMKIFIGTLILLFTSCTPKVGGECIYQKIEGEALVKSIANNNRCMVDFNEFKDFEAKCIGKVEVGKRYFALYEKKTKGVCTPYFLRVYSNDIAEKIPKELKNDRLLDKIIQSKKRYVLSYNDFKVLGASDTLDKKFPKSNLTFYFHTAEDEENEIDAILIATYGEDSDYKGYAECHFIESNLQKNEEEYSCLDTEAKIKLKIVNDEVYIDVDFLNVGKELEDDLDRIEILKFGHYIKTERGKH